MTGQQQLLTIAPHLALCDHLVHEADDHGVIFEQRCVLSRNHEGDHLPSAGWTERRTG